MPSPEIILAHLKELATAEIRRQRNVNSLYNQFRLELYDVLSAEDVQSEMTISKLAKFRREANKIIDQFAGKLNRGLKSGLVDGVDMAVGHATSEIIELQKGITGRGLRLNVRASVVMSKSKKLLINQYDSSVARYSEHLRNRIGRTLSSAALKNATIDQVTKELAGTKGLISAESYQVERIARTEYLRAYNIGRHESMVEAQKVLPDLQRRWDATLDSRSCDICEAADGQVVDLDEPFIVDGEEFMTPQDSHPNCRCAEIPYREVWAEQFE